jgi:hypothetical protein
MSRRFGGPYRFCLQGTKYVTQTMNETPVAAGVVQTQPGEDHVSLLSPSMRLLVLLGLFHGSISERGSRSVRFGLLP